MAEAAKVRITRPALRGREWLVIAGDHLAAQAGARVLQQGGNAVDATVAAAAAVGVVEPLRSNILGGESFILLWSAADRRPFVIDGIGYAPAGATVERYRELGGVPQHGLQASCVPGAFDGWVLALERFGTMTLAQTLAPALELAEAGFLVSELLHETMVQQFETQLKHPATAKVFLKDGRPYAAGERLVQPDLVRTFRKLLAVEEAHRSQGRGKALQAARDFFYRGEIAEAIVRFSHREGGLFDEQDFTRYEAAVLEPIRTAYREWEVLEIPPPSQGITLLMALNVLEGYDLKGWGWQSAETIHAMVEAVALTFADREAYIADPSFVKVPTERLLSKAYAEAQRRRIRPDRSLTWPVSGGLGDTTSITVADAQGNLVSVTTSIGAGSVVAGETGILLNNRVRMFHLDLNHPNVVAPGKKVRMTLNPAMALRRGRPWMAFASPGGDVQPQVQLQSFLNVVEFGLTPQEAVEAPRWVSTAFPNTSLPHKPGNALQMEPGFPEAVRQALEAKGHVLARPGEMGSVAMIVRDEQGGLHGGADPRREAYGIAW
ncbi:MAG: gamma-glutamyltransferase [Deltaproteobacteria bacterium]|nr:gamma-glutamyltransferase [Deltaproteobacteria bacterium]